MALEEQNQQIVERVVEAANTIKTLLDDNILTRVEDDNIGFVEANITEDIANTMEELVQQTEEAVNGVSIIFDLEGDLTEDESDL
jgi:hypothetical protein|nr:MAG TPA: hypothetical protein [Myoviridae sp. ctfuG5]DAN24586.1 MAG TPA: hypothetical protein [Caudoviricetes sp.]